MRDYGEVHWYIICKDLTKELTGNVVFHRKGEKNEKDSWEKGSLT